MRESYDPTPPSTWLGRARFTPLVDALRGQLTARLDPRTLIAAAELPAPLPELIYTVVRRSRLWRREQVDVARELIAHFADGLSAGRTPEQLATDFGPAAQAAQLIRRGKIRNRPYLWHAGRFALRAAGVGTLVCIAFYGLLAARFYFSAPTVSRNYWREVNEGRFALEAASAWPLYREALVKLGDPRDKVGHPRVNSEWLEEGINGPHWDELKSVVERQGDAIDLTRAGAKKPHLNYALGNPADREFFHSNDADWLNYTVPQTVDENLPLFEALLVGPQGMSDLARLLAADCLVAASAGDGKRSVEDFEALLSMCEQLYEPSTFLVEQILSLGLFSIGVDQLGQVLAHDPKFLTDEQLQELAHRVAAYRHGNIELDFGNERAFHDDMLQRAFTDDGHGDGHVTATGLNCVPDLAALQAASTIPRATWLIGPGLSAIVAGRAETREITDKHFNETLAAHQGPPWLWSGEHIQAIEDWRKSATPGPLSVRQMFPALMLGGLRHVFDSVECAIQKRDATEVAIALVLFHRRHGTWPQALDELVPDLLPAVPPDRFDGQPLRYVIRDGKPLLYSIGVDRDDNGGRPTKNPDRAAQGPFGPVVPDQFERADEEGDWILWPPVHATAAQPVLAPPPAEEE